MKHEVEVILKSQVKGAPPISTVRTRYWRPIHGEVMTYRQFSRNASSSRAIPVEKLAAASDDVLVPRFRQNQAGMQAGDWLSENNQAEAEVIWRDAAEYCLVAARELATLGVHTQWANRMLEWFGSINTLITSTEWDNFYLQRIMLNEDGFPVPQDEMYELACSIKEAVEAAPIQHLEPGQWHLPFTDDLMLHQIHGDFEYLQTAKKISAARCASISYQTVDGKIMSADKAESLCDKLLDREHWSPFEHQAMADLKIEGQWAHQSWHANYTGYSQWRHMLMDGLR
jgi:hypothetical protein